MLWRVPAPVRSLLFSQCRQFSTPHSLPREPLRILFCGSDEFSIASLRALTQVPNIVGSIHVAHRPAKPTGRGLKLLTEVPIKKVATSELSLPTHAIDTFIDWTPPSPFDLIIAVSFGLLVPPRILNGAKYGGLNVHPSLLPDLRGPAPIEHAIVKKRRHTGVSVQTLHPKHFDRGTILAQTAAPGIPIPSGTSAAELEQQLADVGASMLVDVLQTGSFIAPLRDVGWYASSNGPMDHAPKTTKQDRFIHFATHTIDDILTIQRALGDPWCILPTDERLLVHRIEKANKHNPLRRGQGLWLEDGNSKYPLFWDAHGEAGVILESTLAGSKKGGGNAKLMKMLPRHTEEAA